MHPAADLGLWPHHSPAGQAAWIFEKFYERSDCDGDPHYILSYDEMLDNIMLYWLTGTATSSTRLYWKCFAAVAYDAVTVPTGCSIFPREIVRPTRAASPKRNINIIHWNEPPRGGHFAALEQPDLFVEEVRAAFR